MAEMLHRDLVYLWRYFELQFRQIAFYWIPGMVTDPATKITNLGAVKIVLGAKHFALYWAFTILFALLTGWVVNIIL